MAKDLIHKLSEDFTKKRDLNLVKQTLNGHGESFAKLMSLYKQRVFIFGKSFFHNDSDSEDFVQDVFIKVYQHLNTFEGKSSFPTWLMKIAFNTAVNQKQRTKQLATLENEEILPSNSDSPEELQIRIITRDAIRQAISELPEKYAVCIEMYFSWDIPYQEISEITEIPVNTIKSHIFRAKKILKEKLEGLYEKQ